MLSDDSSSESESGRFKTHTKIEQKESKNDGSRPLKRGEPLPDLGRSRKSDRPFRREFDRRQDDRSRLDRRRSQERYELSRRYSPSRRRRSRNRSPQLRGSPHRHHQSRESGEHSRPRDVKDREKTDDRENKKSDGIEPKRSEDRGGRKRPSPIKAPESKRNFREEIRKNIVANVSKETNAEHDRFREVKDKTSRDRRSERSSSKRRHHSPDECKTKTTPMKTLEVCKPIDEILIKSRSNSPIKKSVEIEIRRSKSRRYSEKEVELSDSEQLASYYNSVPATVDITNDVESVQSITDSDDEERLRAKLLNLERELDKTKQKKVKKSKKKSKSKHKDKDEQVEVSSTTDIQEKLSEQEKESESQMQAAEVSSTQHKLTKESSEEGEITTDDDSANALIDASDLRHRLKKSHVVPDTSSSPDLRRKLKSREDVAGPSLPPCLEKKAKRSTSPNMEGPALPPHLRRDRANIGPSLPREMRKVLEEASHDQPLRYESSEDEGIGPLPADAKQKWTTAHRKLEERALDMKIRSLDGSNRSDAKSREEWMLELPEGKAKYLGLGPRQFRSREAPDMSDRSSWTDTPEQKALKASGLLPPEEASTAALQREAHELYVAERDRNQEKAVKKHKKKHKRGESLLEMHQKKLKKKKKKEEKEDGVKSRRPFDRDVDLQANRFDNAQKQAIIKKSQHLDSRFSSGEAKYL